jgi:hypothetical protein
VRISRIRLSDKETQGKTVRRLDSVGRRLRILNVYMGGS